MGAADLPRGSEAKGGLKAASVARLRQRNIGGLSGKEASFEDDSAEHGMILSTVTLGNMRLRSAE